MLCCVAGFFLKFFVESRCDRIYVGGWRAYYLHASSLNICRLIVKIVADFSIFGDSKVFGFKG